MPIDEEKIDQAVLASLYLTLGKDARAWKGVDFGVMNHLHEKGFTHLANKNKLVLPTDKGIAEFRAAFYEERIAGPTFFASRAKQPSNGAGSTHRFLCLRQK